jgi:GxxExxY protein
MGRHWGEFEGEDHPRKEITQAIIGEAIEIQKALGPGLLEDPYKVCLAHSLMLAGHKVRREVYLDIEWRGLSVERAYRLDLLVDDLVVVEAKAVEKLMDAHFAQLNTQLRFSGMEVGLLLNFRQWPFKEGGIKRVIHTRT